MICFGFLLAAVYAQPLALADLGRPVFDIARFHLQGYEAMWTETTTPVKVNSSADVQVSLPVERALTLGRAWADTARHGAPDCCHHCAHVGRAQ